MKNGCNKALGLLERYFDGELSTRQAAALEDHLVECPECHAELESLQVLRGSIQTTMREAAQRADFSKLWRAIEPRLEEPKPSLWERLGVAAREYLSVYKTAWAAAGAAAAVAAVVAIPFLTPSSAPVQVSTQSNECIIESIESSGGTTMVYELDQDQTKVIWMFEDSDDTNGPSTL